MNNMQSISVCMATYNGEKYIKKQLKSILEQIGESDEVIISDDSSCDRTVSIIKDFKDKRLKLLEGNTYYNPTFNLENALINSTGDVVFISDQDDIWKSNKVNIVMEVLNDYDLVVTDCEVIDQDENIIVDSFFVINKSRKGILWNLYKNGYLGCCMAFNRNILNRATPFPHDIPMHDMWLGVIGSVYGKVCFLPNKLISYRRHSLNSSSATGKSNYSIIRSILFRWILIKNIMANIINGFICRNWRKKNE